jgi:type VI secretion system secreted protein VgrG
MTRSVFKSASTPGGKGANELRIEDRLGREEIYLHAERDLTQRVNNDHRLEVDGQRHDSIAGNSHTEIKAEEHRITHKDRKVTLHASDHLQVANSQHTCVGLGQFVEAGEELHYKAGLKGVIEAGIELTLKAGGHFLTLNPSGIWHNGQLLLGGSPVAGSGAQRLSALPPVTAAGTGAVDVPAPALPRSLNENNLLDEAEKGGATCAVCEACRDKVLKALSSLA